MSSRLAVLLERDAALIAEIVDAIAKEVPVDRRAVFLVGTQLGAEAALGVAARQPGLFAGVVLRETESSLTDLQRPSATARWVVLPEAERLRPALDLPVLIGYDPTEHNGDVRVRMAKGARTLLEKGIRHAERRNLKSALLCQAKAHALETEHELDAASAGLYAELAAQGRAILEEADGESPATRRRTYRKVAKLFAGTPLGDEAKVAIESMK